MKLESITLRNFKVFRNITMKDIPSLCIIVGANGVGKTTLFDVFGFLKDCLTYDVNRALQSRGGFNEVVSRKHSNEPIYIEIQFSMEIVKKNRLVTYVLEIVLKNKKPVIKREILRYKRGSYGSPYHFLDFKDGKGFAITNEEEFKTPDKKLDREDQALGSGYTLAIKGLGQFQRFKAANAFRQLLEQWYVFDFHINMARGSKEITGYADHLSESGDNLQQVAKSIHENNPEIFQKIIETMRARIPGVSKIETELTSDGRLLLKFLDDAFEDPFIDRWVSDGTLKMFAYLILLYDPEPHPLLCVEEPENQLYPHLLHELAEEFRNYSNQGGQVFISTHSPDFLNAAELEEVFWMVKKDGYTQIERAKSHDQIATYMKSGDQMGYLWKQGFFEGADPS